MSWNATVLIAALPIALGLVLTLADTGWRRRISVALMLVGVSLLTVAQARDRNDPAGLILPWILAGVWAWMAASSLDHKRADQDESDPSTDGSRL